MNSVRSRKTAFAIVVIGAVASVWVPQRVAWGASATTPMACQMYAGYKHAITMWPDDHIHLVGTPTNEEGTAWWTCEEDTVWKSGEDSHITEVEGTAGSHHSTRCPDIEA